MKALIVILAGAYMGLAVWLGGMQVTAYGWLYAGLSVTSLLILFVFAIQGIWTHPLAKRCAELEAAAEDQAIFNNAADAWSNSQAWEMRAKAMETDLRWALETVYDLEPDVHKADDIRRKWGFL